MRLKELRKSKKYKQTDIADVLSCSQGVYSRYESGEREPPLDIIKKLADFYGVSVDFLMGSEAKTEPSTVLSAPQLTQKKAAADMRAEAKELLESMTDEEYELALAMLKLLQGKKR